MSEPVVVIVDFDFARLACQMTAMIGAAKQQRALASLPVYCLPLRNIF